MHCITLGTNHISGWDKFEEKKKMQKMHVAQLYPLHLYGFICSGSNLAFNISKKL